MECTVTKSSEDSGICGSLGAGTGSGTAPVATEGEPDGPACSSELSELCVVSCQYRNSIDPHRHSSMCTRKRLRVVGAAAGIGLAISMSTEATATAAVAAAFCVCVGMAAECTVVIAMRVRQTADSGYECRVAVLVAARRWQSDDRERPAPIESADCT